MGRNTLGFVKAYLDFYEMRAPLLAREDGTQRDALAAKYLAKRKEMDSFVRKLAGSVKSAAPTSDYMMLKRNPEYMKEVGFSLLTIPAKNAEEKVNSQSTMMLTMKETLAFEEEMQIECLMELAADENFRTLAKDEPDLLARLDAATDAMKSRVSYEAMSSEKRAEYIGAIYGAAFDKGYLDDDQMAQIFASGMTMGEYALVLAELEIQLKQTAVLSLEAALDANDVPMEKPRKPGGPKPGL